MSVDLDAAGPGRTVSNLQLEVGGWGEGGAAGLAGAALLSMAWNAAWAHLVTGQVRRTLDELVHMAPSARPPFCPPGAEPAGGCR